MFFRKNLRSIAWALFIFIATMFPGKKLKYSPIFGFDKFVHLGLFAILMFLILRDYDKNESIKIPRVPYLQLSFFVCTLYGIFTEICQYFTPTRTFSLYDWAADILGLFLGYFFYKFISKK